MTKHTKIIIWVVVGLAVVAGIICYFVFSGPPTGAYTRSQIKALGILPSDDGKNQWMYTDQDGNTTYGDAATCVATANADQTSNTTTTTTSSGGAWSNSSNGTGN